MITLAALATSVLVPAHSAAEAGDVGHRGPTFDGAAGSPSGSRPQSKLWFHHGSWWGVLWQAENARFEIFRLDADEQTWQPTGAVVDERRGSRSDVLWDGSSLYVASHYYGRTESTGHPSYLLRYSYEPLAQSWTLDPGFPTQINDVRGETLVIDQDSTGTLWATWTFGNEVYVNRGTEGGLVWDEPFRLAPGDAGLVGDRDISSVQAFGGDRVGVFWSNQRTDAFYFSIHVDGAPTHEWSAPEVAYAGPGLADDHVNLKADAAGNLYAVVKTERTAPGDPLIVLLRRTPAGAWSSHVVATTEHEHTRPIVQLDEQNERIHVFATAPRPGSSSTWTGGDIYRKSSAMAPIDFDAGLGTLVISDHADDRMNNASSTKQSVSDATGLVVLATNDNTREYWHSYDPVVSGPATEPVAEFSSDVTQGAAPLAVGFTDLSTGPPAAWAWDFGDGGTSTEQHPSHVYEVPGTYTVSLTASNEAGTDTVTRIDHITVTEPSPAETFTASGDTHLRSDRPTSNYGTLATMRIRGSNEPSYRPYVKFDLPVFDRPIADASLRLWVHEGTEDGGELHVVSPEWSETTITWDNAPAPGQWVTSIGAVVTGTWATVDVTDVVADGASSFAMVSNSHRSGYYSTREGTDAPELVVTFADDGDGTPTDPDPTDPDPTDPDPTDPDPTDPDPDPPAPTASFSADVTAGEAPLTVSFTDTSDGDPTAWAWDFGDGGASTEQHPTHIYEVPGTYTVTLTATNAEGSDTATAEDHITVVEPSQERTFLSAGDAHVRSNQANRNFGSLTSMRIRGGGEPHYRPYVRFDVGGIDQTVTSATLRLWVDGGTRDGGEVHVVAADWDESTITWANAPQPERFITSVGPTTTGTWAEVDVSSEVTGSGSYAFVLISANSQSGYYSTKEGTHAPELVLSVGGEPSEPVADFVADVTAGPAPHSIEFTDTSTGPPAEWHWDFGDGATSQDRNPTHLYQSPGTYTVTLTVTNSAGTDTLVRQDYILVSEHSGALVFTATGDAHVRSSHPDTNYGSLATMRTRGRNSPFYRPYVQFQVTDVDRPVVSATLRLWVEGGTDDGGELHLVSPDWHESTITWSNAPALGQWLASAGPTTTGTWVELDVTSVVTTSGSYAFALESSSHRSGHYATREGTHPPELVIELSA